MRRFSDRARSIADLATDRVDRPEIPLWAMLSGFLDEFYEADGDEAMLSEEPNPSLCQEEAAYLAGVAEYLSLHYALPTPGWTRKPRYFLRKPYFPGPWRRDFIDKLCTIESPYAFRHRLVFVENEPMRRKLGPKTRLTLADRARLDVRLVSFQP